MKKFTFLLILSALIVFAPKTHAVTPTKTEKTTITTEKATPITVQKFTKKQLRQQKRFQKRIARWQKRMEKRADISPSDDDKLIAILLTLVFPPLGVWYWEDDISSHFWIAFILTLLLWLPGFIYALIIITKK